MAGSAALPVFFPGEPVLSRGRDQESWQERPKEKGRIRKWGADSLVYAILDAIVDEDFAVVEVFDEAVVHLEDKVLTSADEGVAEKIGDLRSSLLSSGGTPRFCGKPSRRSRGPPPIGSSRRTRSHTCGTPTTMSCTSPSRWTSCERP